MCYPQTSTVWGQAEVEREGKMDEEGKSAEADGRAARF